MSSPLLASLVKQDASRLPCGELEQLVYSCNRRKLLHAKILGLDEEDTKGENDRDKSVQKTLFVAGSEDEYFYNMLQIDNEIEKELNGSEADCDKDQLNKLQNEFEEWLKKVNDKWPKHKQYNRVPMRLRSIIFRNRCRFIVDINDMDQQLKYVEEIEKEIAPTYDYSKPRDSTQGVYHQKSQSETRNYKAFISADDLQKRFKTQMISSLTGYYAKNVLTNYKTSALSWLIRQNLSLKQKQNIISNYYNKLLIVGESNKEDEAKVMQMILDDLKDKDYDYARFGFRTIHNQLTLSQLDELKTKKPDLLSVTGFIQTYLKKLMPLDLGIYVAKDWNDEIPIEMRWKYIKSLYDYANGDDLNKANYSASNSIRCYIYYQFMIFIEQNYYLLNKATKTTKGDMIEDGEEEKDEEVIVYEGFFDGAYDLEAIIRYLLIPKSASYNALFCDNWYKSHNSVSWGSDTRMSYNSGYPFLSQFDTVPQFSNHSDNSYFERFFEYIFTEKGRKHWSQFIEEKDNITDDKVLKFLYIATVEPSSIIPTFSQYIDGEFIEKIRLRSIINNAMQLDKLDENIKKLKDLDGYSYVSRLKDEVLIEFDEFKNCKSFGLKDTIEIFVNVKNVADLNVKVFEINTKSYYRDKEQAIETDMNLDGLHASHEWLLTNKDLGIKNSYHKKQIKIDFPDVLNGKRGIYFVDVLSNGRHSRSVIKIGAIRYISRVCEAGHMFKLLDEQNKVIKKGSIFMSTHLYKSNKNGEIFIPFTTKYKSSQNIILERADDPTFNVLSTFNHETENYSMQCGIYVDREQLLEKKRANVVVRAGLFLNGTRVTNELLENCELFVNLKTSDGVDVEKTFRNFELKDETESVATFTVANEPRTISIRLDAQVKNMSQNKKQSLSKSVSFKMNSIDSTSNIGQMFLIPQYNNAYIVALYGKNGEGINNKDIELSLDSKYYKSSLTFKLSTDAKGRVYLPKRLNDDFIRLRASCASVDGIRCDWDLNDGINYCDTANIIQMTTNASVSIPYAPKIKPNKDFKLAFGLMDKYYIQSYTTQHLQYDEENGYIIIKDLPAGNFILKCLDLDYDINIYVTESGRLIEKDRYNVTKNEIVELSANKALQISKVEELEEEKESVLKIQLNGVNDRTRVHILATHMISRFSIAQYLNCIDSSSLSTKYMRPSKNFYLEQRMIGEELRYILEREKAKTFIGNSLIRPSFLMKPLEHKSTSTETQTAKKGDDLEKRALMDDSGLISASQKRRKANERISNQSPNDDPYNIEFIGATCTLIENRKPDLETGSLTVDLSSLNINQTFVRVIAFDEEDCIIRGLVLKPKQLDTNIKEYECPPFEYADNRMNPGLNPKYQYVDERNIVLLHELNNDYVLDDFKTSQIETYQSFHGIFNLIQTISGNHELKIKWSFLTQWNVLSEKEKMKKYDEFFCHELHLFLKKKDKAFFDKVCKPLIASKLNKDFMDYYLLNDKNELLKYCKLDRLQSLNPLEQILLAQFFKKENKALASSLLKFYESKQDSLDVNPQIFDTLFRTALATKAMDEAPTFQQQIKEEMKIVYAPKRAANKHLMRSQAIDDWGDDDVECMADECAESESEEWCTFEAGDEKEEEECSSDEEDEEFSLEDDDDDDDDSSDEKESKKKAKRFGSHQKQREEMRQIQLFKQVEETKEYQETYYYNILFEQNTKDLIPLNKFWASFAIHILNEKDAIANKPFLSDYFLFATRSINEILCVLAVIDVPFNEQNISPQFKFGEKGINDRSVRLIAQSPTILFAKELKKQQSEEDTKEEKQEQDNKGSAQSISIHVVYFDPNDRYTTDENGERMDKFINKYDFRPGKIYGCLSILTNVSSIRQSIEILCQIPTGSIPVNDGFRTKTNFITLSAYSVHKFEFYFYYPVIGVFRQYPIVVTKKNTIIGSSKKTKTDKCKIIVKYQDKDKKVDIKSWNDVSLNGSNADILKYLASHNLNKLDVARIYYKLNKDKAFYDELIQLFRAQAYYNSNIWAIQFYYFREAVKSKSIQEIKARFAILQEYVSTNATFKSNISPCFKSPQFEYDDLYQNKYNYLEYIPLVNARAHLLGQKREILNDAFKSQYQKCLYRCAYRSTSVLDLKYNDILSLMYYLLLQDRIEESLSVYSIINENKSLKQEIEDKVPICFDYFQAYMALFVDDSDAKDNDEGIDRAINIATEIATKYRNASLIASKRKLFEDIEVLLSDLNDYKREDEDDADAVIHGIGDRNRAMDKLANKTPSLDFVIQKAERKLIISTANIKMLTINFYMMNTEILFSNSPFFEENNRGSNKSAFAYIAPNINTTIEIKADEAYDSEKTEFLIPSDLKNTNLFVQVISSTLNVSKPFYDHELNVLIKESYGALKVLVPSKKNKNKLIPLQKAYVKVYSQTNYGESEFYKDGYTDIRGKFDYASISTDQLNKTQKFAIFVKAPGFGSMIKECSPPKR